MSIPLNIYARTAPGLNPEYLSINWINGRIELTARSKAAPIGNGATAMISLTVEEARAIGRALLAFPVTEKVDSPNQCSVTSGNMQQFRIPDFRPSPKHERPIDELDRWSERNWAMVPEFIRNDCESHLRAEIGPYLLGKWMDQRRRGIRIGSDDPRFHFGVGMAVRNTLRAQLLDEELPEIISDHEGKPYGPTRNWDDYYFGVLAAIAA